MATSREQRVGTMRQRQHRSIPHRRHNSDSSDERKQIQNGQRWAAPGSPRRDQGGAPRRFDADQLGPRQPLASPSSGSHQATPGCSISTARDGVQLLLPLPMLPRPIATPAPSNSQGQRRVRSRTRGSSRAISRRAVLVPSFNTRGRSGAVAAAAASAGAAAACCTRRGRVCDSTGRVKVISRGRSKQAAVILLMAIQTSL